MTFPALKTIRRAQLFLAAFGFLAGAAHAQQNQNSAPDHRRSVLVELFTSEGCSDCPPADALLAKLDREQYVPGAQAIVLSEHVTYWNHLGWRDPFSFAAMDERQQTYSQQFGLNSVYTPQAIVDGAAELVGNNAGMLQHAVLLAAEKPKIGLTLSDVHRAANGTVDFKVQAATRVEATLIAALAENATRSEVARGENAGRTLHHVAVVRVLNDFGSGAADGRQLSLAAPKLLPAEKDGEPLRLVVFLVDRSSGHVLALAQQTLGR